MIGELPYLWQASLIMAILTLCYQALLRRTTWFGLNRCLLWLNMGLALLLPVVELPETWLRVVVPEPVSRMVQRSVPAWALSRQPTPRLTLPAPAPDPEIRPEATGALLKPEPVFDWEAFGWRLYVLGVVGLALRFLVQLVSLARLIRRSERQETDEAVCLVFNRSVAAPFSFFHWIVLDPVRRQADDLEQILLHEQAHCRQGHSFDRVAAELFQIIFWFNPFAWWHGRLVKENLEFMADREVLNEGVDRRLYQYHLLKASLGSDQRPNSLVSSFSPGDLRARLLAMNRLASPQTGLKVTLFLVVVLAMSLWLRDWPLVQRGPYMATRPNRVYWVLSSRMTSAEIRRLQGQLSRQHIKFYVQNVQYDEGSNLIRHARVVVWSTQRRQVLSFDAGVPYSKRPLMPLGFRCSDGNCTVGLVDKRFPDSLRELALHDEQKTWAPGGTPDLTGEVVSNANLQYGLFEIFYLNDFIESNYHGLTATMVCIRPDHRLDLYPKYQKAVIICDGREISRNELRQIPVLSLKKVSVYKGQAAITRLGDERARHGLVILSRRLNDYIHDNYVITQYSQPYYPPSLSDQ